MGTNIRLLRMALECLATSPSRDVVDRVMGDVNRSLEAAKGEIGVAEKYCKAEGGARCLLSGWEFDAVPGVARMRAFNRFGKPDDTHDGQVASRMAMDFLALAALSGADKGKTFKRRISTDAGTLEITVKTV